MELKGRLKLIADKIPVCRTACDIGTDHAYIPIYLVQKNICEKVIASDVRIGPVEAARKNTCHYGLNGKIEVRLGNGLDTIAEEEAEAIIIAGMGGTLISEIILRGIKLARKAKYLVIQPMNDLEIVRKMLLDNGFEIYDEELTEEGTKLYNVICARWTGEKAIVEENIYYHIGRRLIEKNDPLLKFLISRKIVQLDRALEELRNAKEMNRGVVDIYSALLKDLRKLKQGYLV
ncbi:MAG: class I SAM-dependent methyltransferase [Clostridia bacterium]|nr:class I SAM-dependent methyltransferase [Clostridia bacterium]